MRLQHRAGVTLLEVLIAIFIMGIGMLALLTLFPVGALDMGRALSDDRAASAAAQADAIATIQDIRHDPLVVSDATVSNAFTNPFGTALSNTTAGPSYGVYVDPWGYTIDTSTPPQVGSGGTRIARRSISLSNNPGRTSGSTTPLNTYECYRWCTLLDDIYFKTDGTADTGTGSVQRGGRFTWGWLLRRPNAYVDSVVEMSVVVYRDRSNSVLNETPYPATGSAGGNAVTIDWSSSTQPNLRTGRWLLDVSASASNGAVPGYFYRVVNYADLGGSKTLVEFDTNLRNAVTNIVVMEDVIEVFDRGAGWRP